MIVKDGTGTGNSLKINSINQALARATTIDEGHESTESGNGYLVTTNFIDISGSTESGILYIKNTASNNSIIHSIEYSSNAKFKIKEYYDVTSGSLLTEGSTFTPVNNLVGDGKAFLGISTIGAEGLDIVDGTLVRAFFVSGSNGVTETSRHTHIPTNRAIAVSAQLVEPAVGLTGSLSCNVHIYTEAGA